MTETRLPFWDKERFAVPPNPRLLDELTASMREQGKKADLGPWSRLSDQLTSGSMEAILDPWCGILGQLPLSEPDKIAEYSGDRGLLDEYDRFLRSIDHSGCLDGITLADLRERGWRLLDLGSLIDFLLLSAFLDFGARRTRVLEVGGGFGRLAEFLSLIGGAEFQYVNVDVAPVSLMYCHEYLRTRFPEKRVVLFSPDQPRSDFDFLVVPSWHADALPKETFDLAVNIESMQEMNQSLVDYYLAYLDERTQPGSFIYLVNSREWLFKGTWNFPASWEILYRHRTVRSWTADHPAEIFRKAEAPMEAIARLRRAAFEREVRDVRALADLRKLRHEIEMGRLRPQTGMEA
jgi:SAM-dependent methyltransferase